MSTHNCELADQTRIRAFRAGRDLLIVAEGEMPTPGYEADIAQSPIRIFPPQFNLLRCPLPGIFPQVVTPYRVARTLAFPPDQSSVTVHHAAGTDEVAIEEFPAELDPYARAMGGEGAVPGCPEGADEATGFSRALSFDEAFADALAKLPPDDRPFADALARVQVVEVGGLFGGFAGFNDLYVRVCRTIT
jgi:hypothetical protein